jgi:hypothetical protein
MADSRPVSSALEYRRKQAKALLRAYAAGDPAALSRFREHHPRILSSPARLADAQLVIARDEGFASWPKLVKHLSALDPVAAVWQAAKRAVIAGDVPALDRLIREHEAQFREQHPPPYHPVGGAPDYSGLDPRTIVRRAHHFADWPTYERFTEARRDRGSETARFEAAVEAVVDGDAQTLNRLLREDRELVRARSPREHHSMLLHYVGANGVEEFRQKTPANAVEIATILLDAGADVHAMADLYRGSDTLELVATSIHPLRAGVQEALMELLLARGARLDSGDAGVVNSCLANGRGQAADYLAARGAKLDLEGAAGVGRMDVVRGFFDTRGQLVEGATEKQMTDGFAWACEYGQTEAAEYLLDRGVKVTDRLRNHGQTGLHWAAHGAHLAIVRLLLAREAPVEARDESFSGTPLDWALHGWVEAADPRPYYGVVATLVAAGAQVTPQMLTSERVAGDERMLAALRG